MDEQIKRFVAYRFTQCHNCIFSNCVNIACDACKNSIKKNKWKRNSKKVCACLQLKPNKEKSCPFFKEMEK